MSINRLILLILVIYCVVMIALHCVALERVTTFLEKTNVTIDDVDRKFDALEVYLKHYRM